MNNAGVNDVASKNLLPKAYPTTTATILHSVVMIAKFVASWLLFLKLKNFIKNLLNCNLIALSLFLWNLDTNISDRYIRIIIQFKIKMRIANKIVIFLVSAYVIWMVFAVIAMKQRYGSYAGNAFGFTFLPSLFVLALCIITVKLIAWLTIRMCK